MASNLPWFRLYSEIIDDKKIERICRLTPFTKAEVIGVWVILLALASESPERGVLLVSETVPYEMDDFVHITGIHQSKLEDLFERFINLDMLSESDGAYIICKWDNRQFKSDDSSSYVSKHRQKKDVILQGKKDVILQSEKVKYDCNIIDTDTDTEADKETESDAEAEKPTTDLVFVHYESDFGPLTPLSAEKLKDLKSTYPDKWIIDAMKLAVERNARNLAYIEAILKRWQSEGKDSGKKQGKPKAKPVEQRTAEDYRKAWSKTA